MYDVPDESARIGDLLNRVGLGMRRRDRVQTFSRGMKQRLAVARAVLHRPKVLLLDEPYTGLDPQAAQTLTDLLLELAGEGRLILLTTHRVSRGLEVGQRVLVLNHGRLVYDQLRTAISLDTFADTYQTITA
jgi:heme exporter protein A